MAFTYRPSDETEAILSDYMTALNIKDKSKCVSHLINSRPKVDEELIKLRKEKRELEKELEKLNEFVISDRYSDSLERLVKYFGSEVDGMQKTLVKLHKEVLANKKPKK